MTRTIKKKKKKRIEKTADGPQVKRCAYPERENKGLEF
jgi:hypothetical protein